jgi:hypothetical protein
MLQKNTPTPYLLLLEISMITGACSLQNKLFDKKIIT